MAVLVVRRQLQLKLFVGKCRVVEANISANLTVRVPLRNLAYGTRSQTDIGNWLGPCNWLGM